MLNIFFMLTDHSVLIFLCIFLLEYFIFTYWYTGFPPVLIVKYKPRVVLHVVLQQYGDSESYVRSVPPGPRLVFSGIFLEN